jgi:hypothetical protein
LFCYHNFPSSLFHSISKNINLKFFFVLGNLIYFLFNQNYYFYFKVLSYYIQTIDLVDNNIIKLGSSTIHRSTIHRGLIYRGSIHRKVKSSRDDSLQGQINVGRFIVGKFMAELFQLKTWLKREIFWLDIKNFLYLNEPSFHVASNIYTFQFSRF